MEKKDKKKYMTFDPTIFDPPDWCVQPVILEDSPKKYNHGKPMMSLIRPEFQKGLATALTYGYTKYDEKKGDIQNYLKGEGFYYSTIYDSLNRHLGEWWSGNNIDEESGIHHLYMAAANLMFLATYEASNKGIDDRVILKLEDDDESES